MAVKKHIFRFGSFAIKDGSEIRFWEDKSLEKALYCIVHDKSDTLAHVLNSFPPNVSFRRDLIGPCLVSWQHLLSRLDLINLTQGQDVFRWNLTTSGYFTVDSMYRALLHLEIPMDNNKLIWKSKMPLKVMIFMWYLRRGVVLTKDNLARRNWQGSKKRSFCIHGETIKHLFFQWKFARSTWFVIQIASNLYRWQVLPIYMVTGLTEYQIRLIRVGASALLWSLWLCKMIVFLMAKYPLLCRLSTIVRIGFVCGVHYTERSTSHCSRWHVCGWSGWPGRFLLKMGDSIISGSVHLLRRHRHSFGLIWLYCCRIVGFFYILCQTILFVTVCILAMQRSGVAHHDLYLLHASF